MSDSVGAGVGASEGNWIVGDGVGACEGNGVVGDEVGTCEGDDVGACEGNGVVGDEVGTCEGDDVVGDGVGTSVGSFSSFRCNWPRPWILTLPGMPSSSLARRLPARLPTDTASVRIDCASAVPTFTAVCDIARAQ